MKIYQIDSGICIKAENKLEDIALRENEELLRESFNKLVQDAKKAQR